MSWISKNLTLDLIAIAIGGMQSAFDRIKSEPEPGTEWPAAEVPAPAPAAVEPAPQSAPAQQPEPAPAAQEPEPETPASQQTTAEAEASAPQVNRIDEAKAHLRDITYALNQEGIDWVTGVLFPQFGVTNLTDIPADQLPALIDKAVAFKLEKGLQ